MKVGSESWQSSEDHQLLQWIPPYFILSNLYNETAQCETNFCEEEKICYGEKIYWQRQHSCLYLSCISNKKKWKRHTELNVFRINKIDTWMSFWTFNKSRHLPEVLLLTLNKPLPAGFCFSQTFCWKFSKSILFLNPLTFQKTRYDLSAVCSFNNYFKKGILRKVDLPTYKTPSELLQGDAWTSSGIVNGNFCKEEQKKVNVFFKPIQVAQENIDFSFHQELIFHKGKYGESTQQWTK